MLTRAVIAGELLWLHSLRWEEWYMHAHSTMMKHVLVGDGNKWCSCYFISYQPISSVGKASRLTWLLACCCCCYSCTYSASKSECLSAGEWASSEQSQSRAREKTLGVAVVKKWSCCTCLIPTLAHFSQYVFYKRNRKPKRNKLLKLLASCLMMSRITPFTLNTKMIHYLFWGYRASKNIKKSGEENRWTWIKCVCLLLYAGTSEWESSEWLETPVCIIHNVMYYI